MPSDSPPGQPRDRYSQRHEPSLPSYVALPYLRAWRYARELTQEKLGKAAGISAARIREIESGRSRAYARNVMALAAALGISVRQLVDVDPTTLDVLPPFTPPVTPTPPSSAAPEPPAPPEDTPSVQTDGTPDADGSDGDDGEG